MDRTEQNEAGSLRPVVEASIQLAPVAMLAVTGDGRMVSANASWWDLTGTGTGAEAGSGAATGGPTAWLDLLDPANRRRVLEALQRTRTTGRSETVDLEMMVPAGRRWTRWWLQRRDVNDLVVVLIAVIDVHDERARADDLRQLATHDDLTGLVNRRFFLESVSQSLRRSERFGEPVCVLYVDLDGFKAVNDHGGHSIGDRVLASVAARLKLAVRGADIVGRIGGDEFAVLVERLTSPGEADVVARRIEEALNGSVEVAGRTWPIAASVGLALNDRSHDSATAILDRADEAMYRAKRGRQFPEAAPEPAPVPGQPSDDALEIRMRNLRVAMETVRDSLETVLRGLSVDLD
jgi:diguanylate cyclase (GGDEF)-like protein